VGLGTLAPVKTKKPEDHPMHFERLELSSKTAKNLNMAKKFNSLENSLIGKTYLEAIKEKYRFYAFGDTSLIL
jgi:S-adenosylmethionine:tRNA-ribosyltransferase-isomerase (queuine synthetase)